MSDKQKQPVQKDVPRKQQAVANETARGSGKDSDGARVDETGLHRQSGHRVSDQGNRKH